MYRKDLKDEFYTRKAKKEGYPARSVYKLKDIDEKQRVIKAGDRVLDLGASPGSWLLYVAQKARLVVGVDIEPIKLPPRNNITFLKRDILKLTEEDYRLIGNSFDVVIADLAPKTSGVVSLDAGRSIELTRMAFDITKKVLVKGGNFVCKIFDGDEVNDFIKEVEKSFRVVRRARPPAIIKKSREFYIVALGYEKRD